MENSVVNLETSPTTAALDEALAKCQGEIEVADKDKVNPAFRSKYADLTSMWNAARAALSKNGLAVTQWPLSSFDNRLHIITRIAHKGEWMQARFSIPVDKGNAHGFGSAITYAKRFTLSAALGIVADDDDDGNAAAEAHKPGAPGSASGGTDFRPPGPRRMSTNGMRMANDDAHLVSDREKGTTAKAAAPDERAQKIAAKAKAWVEQAIGTLQLSGQSVDSLSRFLADHDEQIRFLEDHAPAEHERFFEVYNEVAERARALVGT